MTVPTTNGTTYPAITINGKTYTPPTTNVDPKGKMTVKSGDGMDALVGQNTTGKSQSQFDGETFLKLLVAQLKYQDPSKPTDTAALMQQTATLSMVERINAMATAQEKVQATYASMLAEARISASVGLVGRTVQYSDPKNAGKTLEGVVDSVKFDGTGPILSVGGKDVPYNDVTSVLAKAATTGTTGSTGSTSSTTGTTTTNTAGTAATA